MDVSGHDLTDERKEELTTSEESSDLTERRKTVSISDQRSTRTDSNSYSDTNINFKLVFLEGMHI